MNPHPFNPRMEQAAAQRQTGSVLPVALILLIVLTFAGLSSARRANTHELVAHNLRVNEVAQQSAEAGLRHCEAVVMDAVDNAGLGYPNEVARLGTVVINDPGSAGALWKQPQHWNAASPHRILAPMVFDANTRQEAQGVPPPQCVAEPMPSGRFLITARGHSADATFDANGRLLTGAEVWLQSILSPQTPVRSSGGGNA